MAMLCKPPEHCFVLMACHRKLDPIERIQNSLGHSWAPVYYHQRNNEETQQPVTTAVQSITAYKTKQNTLFFKGGISYEIEFLACNKSFMYSSYVNNRKEMKV